MEQKQYPSLMEEGGLIYFYNQRLQEFKRIGIGNDTSYVKVTKNLINATEKRLRQLIEGKNESNTLEIEKGIYKNKESKLTPEFKAKLNYDSNRSFIGTITSKFEIADLEDQDRISLEDSFEFSEWPYDEPEYIDKYTTAYRSEIMKEILSHNN